MEFTNDIRFNRNLISNESITITYSGKLFKCNSKNVNLVFGFGENWANTTTIPMSKTKKGFIAKIQMQDYNTFNFCFSNENNIWDNNNSFNYIATIMPSANDELNILDSYLNDALNLKANLNETDNYIEQTKLLQDNTETITNIIELSNQLNFSYTSSPNLNIQKIIDNELNNNTVTNIDTATIPSENVDSINDILTDISTSTTLITPDLNYKELQKELNQLFDEIFDENNSNTIETTESAEYTDNHIMYTENAESIIDDIDVVNNNEFDNLFNSLFDTNITNEELNSSANLFNNSINEATNINNELNIISNTEINTTSNIAEITPICDELTIQQPIIEESISAPIPEPIIEPQINPEYEIEYDNNIPFNFEEDYYNNDPFSLFEVDDEQIINNATFLNEFDNIDNNNTEELISDNNNVNLNISSFNLDGLVSDVLEPVISCSAVVDNPENISLFEGIKATENIEINSEENIDDLSKLTDLTVINSKKDLFVSPKRLRKFYLFQKRIKIALYKLFIKMPKDLAKQLGF